MKKIISITFVYNEEFLLPYFIKHYKPMLDGMAFYFDMDSTDNTLQILRDESVVIIPFCFDDGMDDLDKVEQLNKYYRNHSDDDTIFINIDADEFIFTNRESLLSLPDGVNVVRFADVYRHTDEKKLSIHQPIKEQRCHGVFLPIYNKPIIINGKYDMKWLPGNHVITKGQEIPWHDDGIIGAHWANADPSFCVNRRVKNRKERQSSRNLNLNLSVQNHNITEESVYAECLQHENDPKLW